MNRNLALLFALPILLSSVLGFTLTQQVEGAYPGQNGKIVFHGRVCDLEIFTIDPDGSNLTTLTDNDDEDFDPSWSPDGRLIVFISDRDGNEEVYVMNPEDPNNPRQVTDFNDGTSLGDPYFSADGSKIVFHKYDGFDDEIAVVNLDGTGFDWLTGNGDDDYEPHWAPLRDKIVFDRRNGNEDIIVMNTDGTDEDILPEVETDIDDSDPDWHPSDTMMVFEHNQGGVYDEVYKMNSDGSNPIRLTYSGQGQSQEPAWSPDGKMIVYVYSAQRVDD